MNYDTDEIIIKNAINTIHTPEYDIALEVEKKIKNQKFPMSFKKAIPTALAVCLCLIFSVGVMAANIPSFNSLLSFVSPDIALMLQPIGISSEDNGIKMEVLASMNDDEMAVIYFTMKDLTGDRIDQTLDIYSYSLNEANMFNIQVINYDEITKTATLRMEANGGEKLNDKKISFRINSFLSDKLIFDAVHTDINGLDILETDTPQLIPLDMNNIPGGGGNLFKEFRSKGIINVLKTDQMDIRLPNIDFMYISNIGYIEDHLHIQTKWIGDGIDDHGFLYFTDASGNKVKTNSASISFGTDESGNTEYGHDYIEYIFDADNINLDEMKLMGDFVCNGNYITGNWKTIFKVQSIREEKQVDSNIKFDTWITNSVSVSPMGITLAGIGENNDSQKINVSTIMTDGSIQTFESARNYSDSGEVKIKFISSLPLDVSKVESVVIDGNIININ